MDSDLLKNIYKADSIDSSELENSVNIGIITEKDKFIAAKQILLGLAILYIITIAAFLFNPTEGDKLLDIATVSFPPLATMILVSYFRDKKN